MPDWVVPTEFRCTNPGLSQFAFDPEKWTLKRYLDYTTNVRELEITTLPGAPIQQFAEILAIDGAEISFRGYVERYKKTRGKEIYYCKGIENLLWKRFLHKFSYYSVFNSDSTLTWFQLKDVIRDHWGGDYPIRYGHTSSAPGILHVANSLMPPGMPFTVYNDTYKIIKYSGWGTKSRMGSDPTLYYIDDAGVYELTQQAALGDLDSNDHSFYIDANDLYIRNTHNTGSNNVSANDYWYYNGRILAHNVFDTKIRLGTLPDDEEDNPIEDYHIYGHLRTLPSQSVGDTFFGIIRGFYMYPYLEDKADGYTYVHGLWTPGLEPETGYCYAIDESGKEIISWEKSIPFRPRSHSIRGMGVCDEIYSYPDYTYKGLWYEDIYEEAENAGFGDVDGALVPNTQNAYSERLIDYQFRIKTARKDCLFLRPGDPIKVNPLYDPVEILPIYAITNSSDGWIEVELNKRISSFSNAWQAAGLLSSPFEYYDCHEIDDPDSDSCQFNFRTSAYNNCAVGQVTLHCVVLSGASYPRVILDVGLTNATQTVVDPQRYIVMVSVNNNFNENSIIYNYCFGDSISNMDITSITTPNADNTVRITMYYMGIMPGATQCSQNALITANITMRFLDRLALWG
jgi:hypothetical protein